MLYYILLKLKSVIPFPGSEGSQGTASSSSWTGWAVSSLTSRIYGGQPGATEKPDGTAEADKTKAPQLKSSFANDAGMAVRLYLH